MKALEKMYDPMKEAFKSVRISRITLATKAYHYLTQSK